MTKAKKLLAKMRQNPAGDWSIGDIVRLCESLGWHCLPPTGGGSHWKVTAAGEEAILTVPARRPIKPVYIRQLLAMIERQSDGKAD